MGQQARLKRCERCPAQAILGGRYCKNCKKAVLAELKNAGYLGPRLYHGSFRTADQKEDLRETKFGKDR